MTIVCIFVFIMSTFSLAGSIACTRIIYEQDIEKIELLQQVFYKAYYYTYDEETTIFTVYNTDKNLIGYAFIIEAEGYEDRIEILVGLKDAETLSGISILYSRECFEENAMPGPIINFDDFSLQFVGLKIEDCYTQLRGGDVDGITKATISSNVITDAVRKASEEKIKLIS
jgi:Na+-translocating ferredoxin:NAD+ oxidoreductase RnfG subunit